MSITIPPVQIEQQAVLANITLSNGNTHTPQSDAWNAVLQTGMQAVDVHAWHSFTVVVDNATDKQVTVTLYGCSADPDKPTSGVAAKFQDAFDVTIVVAAASKGSQTYSPESTGWLPIVWASLVAASSPSSGANVTVLLIRHQRSSR